MRRCGVQILEEALLIIVALMGIAIAIGMLGTLQAKVQEVLSRLWDGLMWLFKTVFYFIP